MYVYVYMYVYIHTCVIYVLGAWPPPRASRAAARGPRKGPAT